MHLAKTVIVTSLASAALAGAGLAQARDLTIGLVLSVSGPFADAGKQIKHGIDLFIAEHGDTVAGRKVKLIVKDDTGIAPAIAKRHSQELLVKDKVDILAGYDLTPNAFSAAPLATEGKVPMIVMNAATSSVTEKSPNIVRTSMTLPQVTAPLARWAYANGIKSVYTLVADYGPGHDAEKQFQKTFKSLGGRIIGEARTPVDTADYAAYLSHVKDAKPDAAFFFMPTGNPSVALMKSFKERGLDKAGIRALATGDLVDENELPALGQAAVGVISSFHYSDAHDSPENKAFVAAYRKAFPRTGRTSWRSAATTACNSFTRCSKKPMGTPAPTPSSPPPRACTGSARAAR